MNTITESITYDEDTNTLNVKLRSVFEYLRQIKLHKKQQFSESLENLTETLETRSQEAKTALKNNTLDLTKITMIGTRQSRLNTKIEPYFDGSEKVNVDGGTLPERWRAYETRALQRRYADLSAELMNFSRF